MFLVSRYHSCMSKSEASVRLRDALYGPVVAMTTPFNKDLSLDLSGLRKLTEFYAAAGIRNVIVAGSTGEFFSLDDDERRTVIRTVAEASAGRMGVIGCCAHSGTAMAVNLAKYCQEIGCIGVMVTPPYYSFSGFAGIKMHLEAVSENADIGIVVYFSGSVMRFPEVQQLASERFYCPDEMLELARIPNVGAFKDASKNYGFHRDICLGIDGPDGLARIMGSNGMTYHVWGHMHGSRCYLTSLGNVWPRVELEFFELLEKGDQKAALEIVNETEHPYRVATRGPGKYWSCLKCMLDEVGLPGGYMRPPLLDLSEKERTTVLEMCKKTGLLAGVP